MFGSAVALSSDGNVVAVGATGNDHGGWLNRGQVKVFEWNGSAWVQKGVALYGESPEDAFGTSIALTPDGSTLSVGAYYNDGNGTSAGHVRTFTWSGSAWLQKGLDVEGGAASDRLGSSVALSSDGNILATGAFIGNYVRVMEWDGSTWVQRGTDVQGEGVSDWFGQTISLSPDGNSLAVGAIMNDGNGINAGHVRVYEWNGSNWIQKGGDLDGAAAGDNFGSDVSISLDGNIVAIGGYNNDDNGDGTGHVRIFEWNGSGWVQKGSTINGTNNNNGLGSAVALTPTGDILAIGAPRSYNHARVYAWDNALPVNLIYFEGVNKENYNLLQWQTTSETNNDHFIIECSADGNTWTEIAKVDGAGSTMEIQSYTYKDNAPLGLHTYYRLRQVDTDGAFTYSKSIVVASKENHAISVYPNPVNDLLYINTNQIGMLVVVNIQGTICMQQALTTGINTLSVSALHNGVYGVKVIGEHTVTIYKFLKE